MKKKLAINNKMIIIPANKSKEFIREFNSNIGSSEFMKQCKKAGKLFHKQSNLG